MASIKAAIKKLEDTRGMLLKLWVPNPKSSPPSLDIFTNFLIARLYTFTSSHYLSSREASLQFTASVRSLVIQCIRNAMWEM